MGLSTYIPWPIHLQNAGGWAVVVDSRSDPLVGAFPLPTSFQALLQDRDSCVKALLKAQEKATGESFAYIYMYVVSLSDSVGCASFGTGSNDSSRLHI